MWAKPQPEERLVVVDINEATLSDVGPWPWPRKKVADFVEILLSTYQARAVGLDIVFTEAG
jgi:adenylate cyclase